MIQNRFLNIQLAKFIKKTILEVINELITNKIILIGFIANFPGQKKVINHKSIESIQNTISESNH